MNRQWTAMLVGSAITVGAMSYAAWWHFFDHRPWLVVGSWQPEEPIWPPLEPLRFKQPATTVYGQFTPPTPTATTPEGWQVTAPANIRLNNALEAQSRKDHDDE